MKPSGRIELKLKTYKPKKKIEKNSKNFFIKNFEFKKTVKKLSSIINE